MIQSKTARKMMYSWHGGQSCPLYAAASSGLVADWDALLYACSALLGCFQRQSMQTKPGKTKGNYLEFISTCGNQTTVFPIQ